MGMKRVLKKKMVEGKMKHFYGASFRKLKRLAQVQSKLPKLLLLCAFIL